MFGWEFPPRVSGGLGTACSGLVRGLAENNVSVTLVVPRSARYDTDPRVEIIDPRTWHSKRTREDGEMLRIRQVQAFLHPYMDEEDYRAAENVAPDSSTGEATDINDGDETALYGPTLYEEVFRYAGMAREIARQERFDVIHAHDWMTVPAAMEARNVSGRSFVLHMHSLESDRSGYRMNERIFAMERAGLTSADFVIAVSHYTKQKIMEQYGIEEDRIGVVHNAVSRRERLEGLHMEKDGSKRYVLFLGRMTRQKGPRYFIEAARRVINMSPDIHFIMVGSGDLLQPMKEEVARNGIADNIHFTGFLEGRDLEVAYAISDLYVMPSVSEPFGITALEAITYDVPVIVSSRSGVCEVLPHCETVDFWNTDEIAGKIWEILSDRRRYDELIAKGREALKDISWNVAARKVIDIYKAVMEQQ